MLRMFVVDYDKLPGPRMRMRRVHVNINAVIFARSCARLNEQVMLGFAEVILRGIS